MIELSEQDLLLRLSTFEDSFVERKTSSDKRDWLSTVVGFANSAPVGSPAVLFIGVRNDGTIEETVNLDKLQQTFTELISQAYPPIPTFPKVLAKDGKQFLAIVIPGSPERPHFAGQSYVRNGSETRKASEVEFNELIAQRNSKTREILKWKGERITVRVSEDRMSLAGFSFNRGGGHEFTVEDCNQFYVTIRNTGKDSLSLQKVEISFDNQLNRLRLDVRN